MQVTSNAGYLDLNIVDSKGITMQRSELAGLVTSVLRSVVWVCAFLSSFHKSSLVISPILISDFRFVHYLSMIMMSFFIKYCHIGWCGNETLKLGYWGFQVRVSAKARCVLTVVLCCFLGSSRCSSCVMQLPVSSKSVPLYHHLPVSHSITDIMSLWSEIR